MVNRICAVALAFSLIGVTGMTSASSDRNIEGELLIPEKPKRLLSKDKKSKDLVERSALPSDNIVLRNFGYENRGLTRLHKGPRSPVGKPRDSDVSTQSIGTLSTYTPYCVSLSTGYAYTLSSPSAGASYCAHFSITSTQKTYTFLENQTGNTNFVLYLLRDDGSLPLTTVAVSNNAAQANEMISRVSEPGEYYWYMTALSADGSPVQFGTLAYSNYDALEANDSTATATVLTEDRNTVVANMDSPIDIDYYTFDSVRGQDVEITFEDDYGLGEWVAEYWTGASWVALTGSNKLSSSSAFTALVRVRPNGAVTHNATHSYGLLIGSAVDNIDTTQQNTVPSDPSLVYINSYDSPYGYTLTDQIHNDASWSVRVRDSSNHPIEGVLVEFRYGTQTDSGPNLSTAITDSLGIASQSFELPDCNLSLPHHTITTSSSWSGVPAIWETKLQAGGWFIDVPEDIFDSGAGIGDGLAGEPNVNYVAIGHICVQTLLYTL